MPGNFSAAYALVFCAGLYFPGRLAWILPLATLFVSDILISLFGYPGYPFVFSEFVGMILPNYIGYVALIALGRGLKGGKHSWLTLVCGGLVGAFLFYIVTNTAAWLSLPYPKNLLGWIQALTTGLSGYPHTWEFFRNTLLSGGLFTGFFVGALKLLEPAEEPEEKPAEEAEPEPEEAKG